MGSDALSQADIVLSSNLAEAKLDRGVKSILDWTVREWLEYHQRRVHQGALTGHEHLQQRWMGRDIWKNPLDCWVYQEILYETQPEVVVELGIAYGGNLLYLSHLLTLMGKTGARLVGVDLDTSRAANLSIPGLHLIQGSCQDHDVLQEVSSLTRGRRTMVIADCDHSGDHVLAELLRYSPLVSVGCYYIVEDGICDVMGWDPTTGAPLGDSMVPGPRAAALEFIARSDNFVNDAALREKYLLTYNFDGFLRRVR